jgi:hypothetical protein
VLIEMKAFQTYEKPYKQCLLVRRGLSLIVFLIIAGPFLHGAEGEDLDAHTLRFDGFWFYSQPSGSFHGTGSQGRLDLQKDIDLSSYHTGTLKIEWKFTRKNHLFLGLLPVSSTRQLALSRQVTFQGQTFEAGLLARGKLETYAITPGYQYDIIRRRRGYLGIVAQLDLFYIRGSLSAAAQTLNGTPRSAQASSSTIRAPLPVAGPDFRYYLIPSSRRLFVAGNVLGMYFFGYGNFISSYGTVGVALNRHLNFQGGYQLASRLDIKAKNNRIGLNLSQSGAVAGLEVSF